jgi:lipopolysaccharide biosynthesis glycosyltransferase
MLFSVPRCWCYFLWLDFDAVFCGEILMLFSVAGETYGTKEEGLLAIATEHRLAAAAQSHATCNGELDELEDRERTGPKS